MPLHRFFSTCPKGVEPQLVEELKSLGVIDARQAGPGVWFQADIQMAYRVCMWSRLANRIVLILSQTERVENAEEVYAAAKAIDWLAHMDVETSFAIDFVGRSESIRHTHFGSLRIKDALVDRIREQKGARPSVDADNPGLRIYARLHRNALLIGIDISGESLHRRAYRVGQGAAPLKENLAAAILYRARWPKLSQQGYALLDPMCGSGTFLIEAAWMAADIAPGLLRDRFGFEKWAAHQGDQQKQWQLIREEARQRKTEGLAKGLPEIRGYDADATVVQRALQNCRRAGLDGLIQIDCQELTALRNTSRSDSGLLVTNPPYGERMGERDSLLLLYEHFGKRLKDEFGGWHVALFTGNQDLAKATGLYSHKQYTLFNGPIESRLLLSDIYARQEKEHAADQQDRRGEAGTDKRQIEQQFSEESLSPGASMLANRLKKNARQLDKWARKNNISCYRIYDADMPEYSVAIDRYGEMLQVTEYAPPKSVDPVRALKRFREVQQAVPAAFQVSPENIVYKERRRQKGREQYGKLDSSENFIQVQEGDCHLLVNLQDYLDTGLFLDHRLIRMQIAQMARGKRFLNLFCYTGVASLHAAMGGSASTCSVDMSANYLAWAKKNFALNGLSEVTNSFIQADCLQWLKQCDEKYDLIFLDPPSFSNSKRMEGVLDIQRDHIELIEDSMKLLDENGVLIFSNNLRRFKMSDEILKAYSVEDITRSTIDVDFKRNPHIHNCWLIRR